jgi:hypothetical protein
MIAGGQLCQDLDIGEGIGKGDALVICAQPRLVAKQTKLGSLAYPPEPEGM